MGCATDAERTRTDEEQTHRRKPSRGGKQQLIHTHTCLVLFGVRRTRLMTMAITGLVKGGKATVPAFHARFRTAMDERTRFSRFFLNSLSTAVEVKFSRLISSERCVFARETKRALV